MTEKQISVILPCYNPDPEHFEQTLLALKNQTLPCNQWQLIIVNNASTEKEVFTEIDTAWHSDSRIIGEKKTGLTHARLCGFRHSQAPIIAMVDDDNILAPDYLENAVMIMRNNPQTAALGGIIKLQFESTPPEYLDGFEKLLAKADYGDGVRTASWRTGKKDYPGFSPIGAGMVLRKSTLLPYTESINKGTELLSDRKGNDLSSAGDNDIVMTLLESGHDVMYDPSLRLTHLIPDERTEPDYLCRLNRSSSKSWVLVTHRHGICPWNAVSPLSVPLRKLRMWFRMKPWTGEQEQILWNGSCGIFEGRSQIGKNPVFIKETFRKAGIGKVLYHSWHRPRKAARDLKKDGIIRSWRTARGRSQMQAAALTLPSQSNLPVMKTKATICILTGYRYWYQTLFCLHSLQHFSQCRFPVKIISDGSLKSDQLTVLQTITGVKEFVSGEKSDEVFHHYLPEDRFNVIHQRRTEYPHLKKLTDFHGDGTGWKLVIDSDMLFHAKPDQFIRWLENPEKSICMTDCKTSYGYRRSVMEDIISNSVPSRINVGVLGMNSSEVDWEQIQNWITELHGRSGSSYFQEQALVAMMFSCSPYRRLNAQQYRCLDSYDHEEKPDALLTHYVADAKHPYFQNAWREYLRCLS